MSSLEAAASLFGSDDSASDPFASLGSGPPPSERSNSTADDLFSSDSSSAPDFLSFSSENAAAQDHSREQDSFVDTTHSSNYELGSQPTVPNAASSTQPVSYNQAYNGDWQNYPQSVVNGTSNASSYDPYAPPQHSSVQKQTDNYAPSSYAPPPVPQTNNYSTGYSPYAPPAPAPTAQSYNAYAPSQSAYAPQTNVNQYGTPAYSSTLPAAQSAQNDSHVPPPPAPKAPLNRPKVSNAYDPPFPTTTSRKRPTPSSSVYNAYNPVTSPLSPPPPRPPSNASYTAQAHPPPPRPPSNASYNGQAHPPPPRPSSTASYSQVQHYPPPRPPSNASYSSPTHPPPRPPSNASYSSQLPRPPSRPLSSASYSPQAVQGPPSETVYSAGSTQEPGFDSFAAGQQQSPLASVEHAGYPLQGYGSEVNSGTAFGDESSFDPEGGNDYSEPTAGAEENTNTTSTFETFSPYTPDAPGTSDVPSENTSEHARISSPGVLSNPSRTASPAVAPQHDSRIASPVHGVLRTASPVSVHSLTQSSPIAAPPNPYRPSHSNSVGSVNGTTIDPYAPKSQPQRQASQASSPTSSYGSPYLPQKPSVPPPRSMSISSTTSEDPYAPSLHSRIQSNESNYSPHSMYSQPNINAYSNAVPSSGLGPPQDIYMNSAPTHTPYAPSPSLLGTNDPLGRTSARIPVFNFGFGGKIVTCFHGADKLNTGFDVALASKNSTGIQIRVLNKTIPQSALSVSAASFPGPLFSDPGTPTTGLVRPGMSAQAKTKKARLVNYLEERATEISQGLGYLHSGSPEQRQADGKLVLVKLLKIMVENDGKLSGSPQIESAIRAALVPRLDSSLTESDSSLTVPGFTPADIHGSSLDGGFGDPQDTPITTYSIRPSASEKIQDFLLRGQRRQAYHYALDQKLWAHAMVIASGIDKEAWQETVNEFVKTELGSVKTQSSTAGSSGKEALRVAYSLFSGQGAASVQQLVPQNSLLDPGARLLAPVSHATPMTPNFAAPLPAKIPPESLCQWAETVAMILSTTVSLEISNAITALGDHLAANHWIEAAHACYLLAPQTSPIGGVGNQSARVVLVGSRNPQTVHNFASDPDPIIFSEILEFALSLTPTTKGQEPFGGLPHLQPYRFIRAMQLAEIGDISLANRYCEAITASLNRPSPYFTGVLIDQMRGLSDRIMGVTHVDKAGSWMGGKIGKPSLDSIGGWLEGRFTKLVTGDLDSPGMREEQHKPEERSGFVGPFSQYSTISSTTTSTSPSPQSSVTNLNVYAPPPPRSGSSLSNRSALGVAPLVDRASSAMDYSRPKPSPGPRVASASAATTTFAQSQSFGQAVSHYSAYSPLSNGDSSQDMMTPRPTLETTEEEGQEVTWWGSSSAATPTASSFVKLHDTSNAATSSDGFISPMDNASFSAAGSAPSTRQASFDQYDDEEDLGFGNSKPRRKSVEDDATPDVGKNNKPASKPEPAKAPERPDPKPTREAGSSGSWLGRWWKRDSTPAPVRANLGEEVSFYYDKELKRWVNKSAGAQEAPKPATPPPPRAQTASPAGSAPRPPSAGARPPSTGPPPLRSASTADLGSGKPPMRVRSNLVPDEVGSAPSTPTGSRLAPPAPPPGRPRSQASKRNIRNRYVDVFQQEGAA